MYSLRPTAKHLQADNERRAAYRTRHGKYFAEQSATNDSMHRMLHDTNSATSERNAKRVTQSRRFHSKRLAGAYFASVANTEQRFANTLQLNRACNVRAKATKNHNSLHAMCNAAPTVVEEPGQGFRLWLRQRQQNLRACLQSAQTAERCFEISWQLQRGIAVRKQTKRQVLSTSRRCRITAE